VPFRGRQLPRAVGGLGWHTPVISEVPVDRALTQREECDDRCTSPLGTAPDLPYRAYGRVGPHQTTRRDSQSWGAETTYVDTDEARRLISQLVELGAIGGVLPEYA